MWQLNKKTTTRGFSLLELSIVLVVMAVVGGVMLKVSSTQTEVKKAVEMTSNFDAIEQALVAHRKSKNRLPCPADIALAATNTNFGREMADPGVCTGVNFGPPMSGHTIAGAVPTKALGLPDSAAFDQWGRKIMYVVDRRITAADAFTTYPITDTTTIGDIEIRDAQGNPRTQRGLVALISSGKNGHGAFLKSGAGRYDADSTNTNELENCECDANATAGTFDNIFVQMNNSRDSTDDLKGFDDIVRYKLRWHFKSWEEVNTDGTTESTGTNGVDLVTANMGAPYLTTYRMDAGDVLTRLTDPTTQPAPTTTNAAIAYSPDGQYVAIGGAEGGPFLAVYKVNGETLTSLAAPTPAYSNRVTTVEFSKDSTYLAVGCADCSSNTAIYKRSGDTFTAVAGLADYVSYNFGMDFSPNGQYLAITGLPTGAKPLIVYKRSGDSFTPIGMPDISFDNFCTSVRFSPNGNYLALGCAPWGWTNGVNVFKVNNTTDTFTELTGIPVNNTVYAVEWTPDSNYLLGLGDEMQVLNRAGDVFTDVTGSAIAQQPPNDQMWWTDITFSDDGQYMAFGLHISPWMYVYKYAAGVFTKVADGNIANPPGHHVEGIRFNRSAPQLAPAIEDVTPPINGIYVNAQNLDTTFTFSQAITVDTGGGTPRVALTIGAETVYASYLSGSGTTQLVFRYTVSNAMTPDNDADGIVIVSPIEANGGTLRNAVAVDAGLTFTSPDTTGVLVDTSVPTITGVTPPANDTYNDSDNLDFLLTFTEPVTITGMPRIALTVGTETLYATYLSGSTTNTITFRYTASGAAPTPDTDMDGITMISPVALNGGTIRDLALNNATLTYTLPDTTGVKVSTTGPTIENVTPPANGLHASGVNLDFVFEFSELVNVTGVPRVQLTFDSGTVYAYYVSGTGTDMLTFRYNIDALDSDGNGIAMVSPVQLNGGTIKNAATVDSALDFTAPNTAGVLIGSGMTCNATLALSALNGSNGTRFDGTANNDLSGQGLSRAGDINGDGHDDIIVGAYLANGAAGYSYVVFGKTAGWAASNNLSALNGTNGFRLDGTGASGYIVDGAGDVNGDGYDDILVGAYAASPGGVGGAGSTYVVFGKAAGWAATLDLTTLNGTTGFRLDGAAASDGAGYSVVGVGDVNGDGYDDISVGATGTDAVASNAGSMYIIFGKAAGWAATTNLSTLNGTTGFRLDAPTTNNLMGRMMSYGDINADGYDDLIMGAADTNSGAGVAYVVFGKASVWAATTNLSTLDGTIGFRIDGAGTDYVGVGTSGGDVNGDGYDDIIIGASGANANGSAYVIFGKASGWAATFLASSVNGTTGFRFDNTNSSAGSGNSVSNADVNNDGYDDLIVAAPYANTFFKGYSYVIYGKATGWAAIILDSSLNGTTGFRLDGTTNVDLSGLPVRGAGDVNSDGIDDFLIGAPNAEPNGIGSSGTSYLIFGNTCGRSAPIINKVNVPGPATYGPGQALRFGFRFNTPVTVAGGVPSVQLDIGGVARTATYLSGSGTDTLTFSYTIQAAEVDADGIGLSSPINLNGATIRGTATNINAILTFTSPSTASVLVGPNSCPTSSYMTSLTGGPGVTINGQMADMPMAGVGDINGDGYQDVMGFIDDAPITIFYVLFGKASGWTSPIVPATLNGTDGFQIFGNNSFNMAFNRAGDINGDGFDDIIIGDPTPNSGNGYVYVLYGKASGWAASMRYDSLTDGVHGFRLDGNGGNWSYFGIDVGGAGDVNGDGLDDLIIGSNYAGAGNGSAYIVFGKASAWAGTTVMGTMLDGTQAFRIDGDQVDERFGEHVSISGDINADGYDDILVGAPYWVFSNHIGYAYVIFGKASWGATLSVAALDGTNGFRMDGFENFDFAGSSVSIAGDVNLDGYDDFLVGVEQYGPSDKGAVALVYGKAGGWPASWALSTLNGTTGTLFTTMGPEGGYLGRSATGVGDLNHDGYPDFAMGAINNFAGGTYFVNGSVFIMYGKPTSWGATFDVATLNGVNGTRIDGGANFTQLGNYVSLTGDVNGDGFDDLAMSGYSFNPPQDQAIYFGNPCGQILPSIVSNTMPGDATYGPDEALQFSFTFNVPVTVATSGGTPRVQIDVGGSTKYATYVTGSGTKTLMFRYVVQTGDADANGIGVTSPVQTNGGTIKGTASGIDATLTFVPASTAGTLVGALSCPANLTLSALTGGNGARFDGATAGDISGDKVSNAGDVNGDGFDDIIVGATGGGAFAGYTYVIFGKAAGWAATTVLSSLDGTTGFRLDGGASHNASYGTSAGDVNGDGYDDLFIGAPGANSSAGYGYVVFGKAAGWTATIALSSLDGTTGFRLDGTTANDLAGNLLSGGGDVNGDGYDDLLIGASDANGSAGYSYIVFGKAAGWAATIALSSLNGTTGFRLDGAGANHTAAYVSDAGDINGDGFDDIIIGAPKAAMAAGYTYVVFGKAAGWAATIALSSLDGTTGFRLDGVSNFSLSGNAVSKVGNFNGDAYDDLIVGAGNAFANKGASYVVFGKATGWTATVALSSLDGTIGFRLDGTVAGDRAGFAVSDAGDVNSDGYDDVLIGAYSANGNRGYSYVVYGKASGWAATIALSSLNGATGYRLDGVNASDNSGSSVSNAGDVNNDGYDDFLVGAYQADPGAQNNAGSSYLIFGKPCGRIAPSIVSNTMPGDTTYGPDQALQFTFTFDQRVAVTTGGGVPRVQIDVGGSTKYATYVMGSGTKTLMFRYVVQAGDADGDGIGVTSPVQTNGGTIKGAASGLNATLTFVPASTAGVIVGALSCPANLAATDLTGGNGTRFDGTTAGDWTGYRTTNAGDVNGDGIDDLIIGSPFANSGLAYSYVVFGRASGWPSGTNLLSALDGTNGFRLDGTTAGDWAGSSVAAAGDINGDGYDDIMVGAFYANAHAGYSYVIFGKASAWAATIALSSLDGTTGFRLDGTTGNDLSGVSMSSLGDVNGDGYDDIIIGAQDANSRAGYSYVVFGKASGWAATIALSSLNGTTGFRLDGTAAIDTSGYSVGRAGDVNGDGFDDIIIGANGSGTDYVIFGKAAGWAATIALSSLDGTTGFRLDDTAFAGNENFGFSVSGTGDVNNDGYDDLIMGAMNGGVSSDGRIYVLFGKAAGWAATLDVATLNGTDGFRLDGAAAGNGAGTGVSSAGDVNGDGYDDMLVGAWQADLMHGAAYVIYGKASGWAATINLSSLNGTTGFRLDGDDLSGSGLWVSNAGDVNHDGFDDILSGAPYADGGYSYLLLGKPCGQVAPAIASVTPPANGSYSTAQHLDFTVNYDAAVNVTGTPRIALTIGPATRYASYVSGTGTANLLFRYTVAGGDADANGIDMTSPIDLNAGTIKSTSPLALNAGLTYTPPNIAGVLVDSVAPSIDTVTPPANATYRSAANLDFTFDFDENVIVTGTPRVAITLTSGTVYANYLSGSGTDILTFRYTVGGNDLDANGITMISPIELNSGTIRDAAANNAILTYTVPNTASVKVDAVTPIVLSLTAPPNGTYRENEWLVFDVFYNMPVTVTGSAPHIYLWTDPAVSHNVMYFSGSGTNHLVFRLKVGATDVDANGVTVSSVITLPLAIHIRRTADGTTDADLNLPAIDTSGILVNGATNGCPATLALSTLDGTNGFRLDADNPWESLGYNNVSSAGDVNGDGYDDILVGAQAAGGGAQGAGYVIFGKAAGWAATAPLATLNGTNGFRVNGVTFGNAAGFSLSRAGDVNGDGYDDIIIGTWTANTQAGRSYVVFGKAAGWAATIALSALNGTDGFRLDGTAANDESAKSLSAAGDVNGDGYDDLIIGANRANGNTGYSYVVFGKAAGWAATVALSSLNGTTGFRLDGVAASDNSGFWVSDAGDMNADGFDDIAVAAYTADPGGLSDAGSVYVVFGKAAGWTATVALSSLNGTTGFRLDGVAAGDQAGKSVSEAGDVNNDGYDDLIVGAPNADPGGLNGAGSAYVVFGKAAGWAATIALSSLNGTTGFSIDGGATFDFIGANISGAGGDINDDGYDDLIVGSWFENTQAGASYVIYGKASGWAASLVLTSLNGTTGFRLDGVTANDSSGSAISGAGDVNGDGYGDMLIGAYQASPGAATGGGSVYTIFGKPCGLQ